MASSAPVSDATGVVPPGAAGEPYAKSRSYKALPDGVVQVWLLCDPVGEGRPVVITLPDAQGVVSVLYPASKGSPATFHLGRPDPGAGQIYWPLTDDAGKAAGSLHTFNPGALGSPPDAFTPTFTSITLGDRTTNCRWVSRTRFMGLDARRSLLVTQAGDGTLTYRTFDAKDRGPAAPSLQIEGGRQTADGFAFENNGYLYRLTTGPGPAAVTVLRDGRQLQREALAAWTLGAAPKATS